MLIRILSFMISFYLVNEMTATNCGVLKGLFQKSEIYYVGSRTNLN